MNVTLKNVPEPVYKVMKREAKRNRRSLNAEIILALEEKVAEAERRSKLKDVMARVERFRASLPLLPDSTPTIRAERNRR
jgi:hypothetical protein